MKRLAFLVLICCLPIAASAHPGKTDTRGGHKCLKHCEDWGLSYGEYHLHDKYGNAIRIARRSSTSPETVVAEAENTPVRTVQPVQQPIPEQGLLASHPFLVLLFLILLILLTILFHRLNRRRQ